VFIYGPSGQNTANDCLQGTHPGSEYYYYITGTVVGGCP
jgi:hypothetical protein